MFAPLNGKCPSDTVYKQVSKRKKSVKAVAAPTIIAMLAKTETIRQQFWRDNVKRPSNKKAAVEITPQPLKLVKLVKTEIVRQSIGFFPISPITALS